MQPRTKYARCEVTGRASHRTTPDAIEQKAYLEAKEERAFEVYVCDDCGRYEVREKVDRCFNGVSNQRGKVIHHTKEEADAEINRLQGVERGGKGSKLRVYRCGQHWHVGHTH